ncbi:MAG: substrate-binding domain-containing protein, partial [Rhodoglobus sp.]
PQNMQAAIERHQGWLDAVEGSGLSPELVEHGDYTLTSGVAAMRALLDRAPDLDAVFVASDLMASGAISVLRERGIRVPEDVAIVGFDDSSAATSGEIGITTVHQPSREMGAEMARMLLALLRGEPTERETIMPTRMVVRDSA